MARPRPRRLSADRAGNAAGSLLQTVLQVRPQGSKTRTKFCFTNFKMRRRTWPREKSAQLHFTIGLITSEPAGSLLTVCLYRELRQLHDGGWTHLGLGLNWTCAGCWFRSLTIMIQPAAPEALTNLPITLYLFISCSACLSLCHEGSLGLASFVFCAKPRMVPGSLGPP